MTEVEPPAGPAELGQVQARGVRQDRGALASQDALDVEPRRATTMRERSASFASFLARGVEADGSLAEDEVRARLVLAGFRESADDAPVVHDAHRSVTLSERERGELELHFDVYGIPRHELVLSGRSVWWRELTLQADELRASGELNAPRRASTVFGDDAANDDAANDDAANDDAANDDAANDDAASGL